MTTLWELSDDLLTLENLIEEIQDNENLSQAEKDEKIEALFTDWLKAAENFEEKALRVAAYIRHQEVVANARKEEAKRLRELGNQAQAQADRLKEYLIRQMKLTGKTKIEGIDGKLSLRKKPPKLQLRVDIEELPDEYKKIEVSARNNEIKRAIKANPDFEWAYLEDSDDYSLTIR